MNWDEYFIQIAEVVKLKSKDIHTHIGVVIVGHNHEIVSTGYNSFPRGNCGRFLSPFWPSTAREVPLDKSSQYDYTSITLKRK
jgi:hypothetical protein